ncbi:MAG: hypothetical protein MUF39_00660 [Cyclobacteriaceae bacterium]|nr:hypothetical protein [Cyclobacteriaceae bacterium]
MVAFIPLSLLLYVIAIRIWHRWFFFSGLKVELIAWNLGAVTFNVTLGLLLLFDTIEASPTNVIQQISQDGWALTTLGFCLFNVLFYGVFTILFLTKSAQQNQNS